MCETCKKIPCDRRCPNADDENPIATCDICHGKIFSDEPGYIVQGFVYCDDCIIDCAKEFAIEYDF